MAHCPQFAWTIWILELKICREDFQLQPNQADWSPTVCALAISRSRHTLWEQVSCRLEPGLVKGMGYLFGRLTFLYSFWKLAIQALFLGICIPCESLQGNRKGQRGGAKLVAIGWGPDCIHGRTWSHGSFQQKEGVTRFCLSHHCHPQRAFPRQSLLTVLLFFSCLVAFGVLRLCTGSIDLTFRFS